jgi:hypothetical protein
MKGLCIDPRRLEGVLVLSIILSGTMLFFIALERGLQLT